MCKILAVILVAALSIMTGAQAQQMPQMGLYVDSTRTEHCASGTADYYPIDVYLWASPGENGMELITFQVLYPDIVIPAYLVYNESIVSHINGTPQNGIDVSFEGCQYDWVWVLRHTVLLTSEEPGLIQLYPAERFVIHFERIQFKMVNCLGYGEDRYEPVERVSNVCINFCSEDVTPPLIEDLRVIDHSSLEVTYTEQVTAESAEDTENYFVYNRYIRSDSIFPVSADLLAGDTTVALVFAEPFVCYPDKVFRSGHVADTGGNVWDLLEPFAITVGIADLVVVESIHADTLAGCEDDIIVSCTIMNIGPCSASPSRVQLYYDALTEEGAFLGTTDFGYETFPGLVSGGTAVVQFDRFCSSNQNHTFHTHGNMRLKVDPDNEVDESDENNNEYESPFVVLSPRDVTYELIGDTVRADFGRSLFDKADIPEPVTSYEILWSAGFSGDYETAAVVLADASPEYTCEFPMTDDRDFSAVYIRAVRPAGGTTYFYDNCLEWHRTGVDFPPAAPTGFTGNPVDGDMYLEWEANTEQDIFFYVLEWGETEEFPPVSDPPGYPYGELVHMTFFTHHGWDPGDELYYRLCAVDSAGSCSDFVIIEPWHYSTDASVFMPEFQLALYQNNPNPFNPITTIGFGIKESGYVSLRIYDTAGRLVTTLVDESMPAGSYSIEWNGRSTDGSTAASGVYFYRLTAGKKTIAKKMILLR